MYLQFDLIVSALFSLRALPGLALLLLIFLLIGLFFLNDMS